MTTLSAKLNGAYATIEADLDGTRRDVDEGLTLRRLLAEAQRRGLIEDDDRWSALVTAEVRASLREWTVA